MAVVVGYVPTAEGRAALRQAAAGVPAAQHQARGHQLPARRQRLRRAGRGAQRGGPARTCGRARRAGPRARGPPAGARPGARRGPDRRRGGGRGRRDRHRPAPPQPRRQAHPRAPTRSGSCSTRPAPCWPSRRRTRREPSAPRLRIAQDEAADALLARDPFALLVGMLLDQQFPMEKAFAGPAIIAAADGSGTTSTRAPWPAPTPRRSPSSWPARRPCTGTTRAWPAGCRRWPRTCVERYDGDAAAAVARVPTSGADLAGPAARPARLRRPEGPDLRRAARQAVRRPARRAGRRRRAPTRRPGAVRWPTSSTPTSPAGGARPQARA